MKSFKFIVALVLVLSSQLSISQVPFTPGNIVISRVGDGTTGLSNISSPIFLDEYTPSGSLVQSIQMPVAASGANKMLTALNQSDAQVLTLSPDMKFLTIMGYDAAPGTNENQVIQSALYRRTVGIIDAYGNVNTSTALVNVGGYPLCAVTKNGTDLWFTSQPGPIRYSILGLSVYSDMTASSAYRSVVISKGQLFSSVSTGAIAKVGNGTPTSGTQPPSVLPGLTASGAPCQFFFVDLNQFIPGDDVVYVAQFGANALRKYSLVNGTWISNGQIGTSADKYSGIAVSVTGTTTIIYASRNNTEFANTGGGEVIKITDNTGYSTSSSSFSGTPVIVVPSFAGSNKAIRGVSLVPVKCKMPLLRLGVTDPISAQLFITDSLDAGGPYEYAVTTTPGAPTSGFPVSSNIIVDNTLNPGVHYYMHVRRNCGGGVTSEWATVDFTTVWPPCTAPGNFTQSLSNNNVIISWSPTFTAVKYEYTVSSNPTPQSSGQFVTSPTVTLPGLRSTTQYYLHVRSYCGGGDTSGWSTKAFVTNCFAPLPYLIANNRLAGSAEIGWTGEPGDQLFEYAILTSEAPVSSSLQLTSDTSLSVKDLIPGQRYYFSVRQRCSGGSVSEWGRLAFNVSGIHVFPNPSPDLITIHVYGSSITDQPVYIYDATGKILDRVKLVGNTGTLNIGRYSKGVYFIRYGNTDHYTTTLLKQ